MPQRLPKPVYTNDAKSDAISTNLGALPVPSSGIIPKNTNGQSIIGMEIQLTVNITQSAASAWTVGQLINSFTVTKGTNKMVDLNSFAQLQKFYNSLTSLTDTAQPNTYFNNPSSAGAAGASSNTLNLYLPLNYTTEQLVTVNFGYKAYSAITNCTGGSVTAVINYLYSTIPVQDDYIKAIQPPTALSANTDIDLSQFYNTSNKVLETWIDVTVDTNLNAQWFTKGSTTIYDKHTPFELRAETQNAAWQQGLAGFLCLMDQPVVYPIQGTPSATVAKPALMINLSASIQPTIYLFLQP